VVAGIVSIAFTVRSAQKDSDSKGDCDANNDCGPVGYAARNDAFDFANVATGAGILGVVGLGAGTALYLTAPSDVDASGGAQRNSPRPAAALGLSFKGVW
jgi:hypothetical protein